MCWRGRRPGGEIRLDVQLRRRDGRLMPFLMMGRVAPGAGGEAQVYAILWDVRETNRTQEELLAHPACPAGDPALSAGRLSQGVAHGGDYPLAP